MINKKQHRKRKNKNFHKFAAISLAILYSLVTVMAISTMIFFSVKQESITGAATESEYGILGDISSCQTLDTAGGSYTVTSDITATGTCFSITANNVVLDGNNRIITSSSGVGSGVHIGGVTGVTVKNFAGINNFTSGVNINESSVTTTRHTVYNNIINLSAPGTCGDAGGIFVLNAGSNNLSSNTIYGVDSCEQGIYLYNYSNNNTISLNTITGSGYENVGIYIYFNSTNNSITHNTITMSSDVGLVYFQTNSGINTFDGNTINQSESSAGAVVLYGRNNDLIISNNIITSEYVGINIIGSNNNRTILLNNNITGDYWDIYDTSSAGDINYLIYNNSFGEIRWTDNGSKSYLFDLTLNGTGGIGLGKNLFIDDNIVALNTSAFGIGRINATANITLYGLSFDTVTDIYKDPVYRTSSGDVSETNCTACTQISYSGGTLVFNTTSFSSFKVDGTAAPPTPEFSDYTVLLILIIVGGGFFAIRTKESRVKSRTEQGEVTRLCDKKEE